MKKRYQSPELHPIRPYSQGPTSREKPPIAAGDGDFWDSWKVFAMTGIFAALSFGCYEYAYHRNHTRVSEWFTHTNASIAENVTAEDVATATEIASNTWLLNDTAQTESDFLTIESILFQKQAHFEAETEILQKTWLQDLEQAQTKLSTIIQQVQALPTLDLPETPTEDLPSVLAPHVQVTQDLVKQTTALENSQQRFAQASQRAYEQVRLLGQLATVEAEIQKHADIAVHFHSQGKAAATLSFVVLIMVGPLGVLIGKAGWDQSSKKMRYAFLLLTAIALFFNQLPNLLKNEANYKRHRDLYLSYLSLRNHLHSFIATEGGIGDDPNQSDTFSQIDTNRFIHSVDSKLAELNQLSIGLDYAYRVNVSDALEIPQSSTPH